MPQTACAPRADLIAALQRAIVDSRRLAMRWGDALGKALGLHPTDALALIFLLDAGETTAGELARAVGLTTGAMTMCVDRLEKAGLATRKPCPGDRRKVLVQAVKPPRRALDLRRAARGRLRSALERYSDDEIGRFLEFQSLMNELMQLSIGAHAREDGRRT